MPKRAASSVSGPVLTQKRKRDTKIAPNHTAAQKPIPSGPGSAAVAAVAASGSGGGASTLRHDNVASAFASLSAKDPVMAELLLRCGGPSAAASLLEGSIAAKGHDAFFALAMAIAYQQLSTKAGATIWGRVVTVVGGHAKVSPAAIEAATDSSLRSAGLSGRKVEYMKSLASHFSTGKLSTAHLHALDDAAAIEALTAVRGIGVWSAHMFLLFGLNRSDIMPWGDLGIKKGFRLVCGGSAKKLPERKELEARAAVWAPHRSLAAWALWRALDLDKEKNAAKSK